MYIDHEEVLKVARLARLELAPNEIADLAADLSKILQYANKLHEVDTSGVTPWGHALGQALPLVNAFREDEVLASLPQQEALANAPLASTEAFVVPKVI